jgi:pyruvate formate lyase activating enzyme
MILKNLQQLARAHEHVIVRFPLIPGVNDDDSNIFRMGKFISSLETVKEIDILPYHGLGVEKYKRLGMVNRMPEVAPPSALRIGEALEKLESFGLKVKVGG